MKEIQLSFFAAAVALLSYFVWISEFKSSGELLIHWFQRENSVVFRLIFQLLDVLLETGLLVLSAFLYLLYNREVGVLGMMAGFIAAGLAGILKFLIAEPRPFWEHEDLKAMMCPSDYGMPSGHALSVGCNLFVLARLLIQSPNRQIGAIALGMSIISIDRLYLGAHYYHQIIVGFALAQCLASVLIKFFEKRHSKYWIAGCIAGFCFGLAAIFNFSPLWEKSWTENYTQKGCGNIDPEKNREVAAYSMTLFMLVAGLLIGYLHSDRKIPVLTTKYLWSSIIAAITVFICPCIVISLLRLVSFNWLILVIAGLNMLLTGFALTYLIPEFIARKLSNNDEAMPLDDHSNIII